MNTNRALGAGNIKRLSAHEAVIYDDKLGDVLFPLAAARIADPTCRDLTDKFGIDDMVYFTAQRIQSRGDRVMYSASSVIKPRQLHSCKGEITSRTDKYCYIDVQRYGRVFVPFSTRNERADGPWLGRGCELKKIVDLKIFRQPEINQCKYVAWSVAVDMEVRHETPVDAPPGKFKATDETVKDIPRQIGVIITCTPGEAFAFSSTCGHVRLPASLRQPWTTMGRWIEFDVVMTPTPLINKEICDKYIFYDATNISDKGTLFPIVKDEKVLSMEIHCVVNKVSETSASAWFWNDLVGRVYSQKMTLNTGLEPFEVLKVTISYNPKLEDVPWYAENIESLGDNPVIRHNVSQLLYTTDNWKVTFVQYQPPTNHTFYAFMERPTPSGVGAAFFAWTDTNISDRAPPVQSKCRATLFKQWRNGKHQTRAVLVTNFDPKTQRLKYPHPEHQGSGIRVMPEPIEKPTRPAPRPALAPPPGLPPLRSASNVAPAPPPRLDGWVAALNGSSNSHVERLIPSPIVPARQSPIESPAMLNRSNIEYEICPITPEVPLPRQNPVNEFGVIGGELHDRRLSNGSLPTANSSLSSSSNAVFSLETPPNTSPVQAAFMQRNESSSQSSLEEQLCFNPIVMPMFLSDNDCRLNYTSFSSPGYASGIWMNKKAEHTAGDAFNHPNINQAPDSTALFGKDPNYRDEEMIKLFDQKEPEGGRIKLCDITLKENSMVEIMKRVLTFTEIRDTFSKLVPNDYDLVLSHIFNAELMKENVR